MLRIKSADIAGKRGCGVRRRYSSVTFLRANWLGGLIDSVGLPSCCSSSSSSRAWRTHCSVVEVCGALRKSTEAQELLLRSWVSSLGVERALMTFSRRSLRHSITDF